MGREVAHRNICCDRPGRHFIDLDGRDHNGQPLASGIYWIRLEAPSGRSAKHWVLLR